MKLLKKQTVFLSSAENGSGTRGNFSISLPQNDEFDETLVFKIWISQLHIRNTFSTVTAQNDAFSFAVTNPTAGAPTVWAGANLPHGALLFYDVPPILQDLLFDDTTSLKLSSRFGRLYCYDKVTTDTHRLWLRFPNTSNSAHRVFGFDAPGDYEIIPDVCPTTDPGDPDAYDRFAPDGGSYNPSSRAMSPNLMSVAILSHLLLTTSLPGDNYIVNDTGVSNAGVTCDIPITVDPLALVVYTDKEGVNAIYEKGRTVVSTLIVTLTDKNQKIVEPSNDWSFVLNIEEYRDSEQLLLDGVNKTNDYEAEVVQVLKMLLLQREYKRKKSQPAA